MRSLAILFLGVACATGCASVGRPGNGDVDLDLIRPYTFEIEKERPAEAPYVARFRAGGRTLLYIASEHVSAASYPDLLEHPTFKTVRKAFQEASVGAVVVEGIDPWEGPLPKRLLDHADACEASAYRSGCGESWYAIQQARRAGAEILTGEPEQREILAAVLAAGYSAEDLLGFYLVRQIPQWKREGRLDAGVLREKAGERLARFQKRIGTDIRFRFEELERWYRRHMTRPASLLGVVADDTAPNSAADATYVQKISSRVGIARDRSVVSRIASALQRHSTVLVVYGGSHLGIQRPALDQWLGKPEILKWFP